MRLLDLDLELHPDVYEPSDDSLLLARHVDARPRERVLDVCTGTGLAALVAAGRGARVVATDLNPVACELARRNALRNRLRLTVVCTDLAAGVAGQFDLVTCNPPYLPTAPEDRVRGVLDRALSGGPDGAEVARQFIAELPRLLAPGGRAFLIVSTLQPLPELERAALAHGLAWTIVERHPLGMEALLCVRTGRHQ